MAAAVVLAVALLFIGEPRGVAAVIVGTPVLNWSLVPTSVSGPLLWGEIVDAFGVKTYPRCSPTAQVTPRSYNGLSVGISSPSSPKGRLANEGALAGPLRTQYTAASSYTVTVEDFNNERPALVVAFTSPAGSVKHPLLGTVLALKRVEFRFPSEHYLGGALPVEMRLVHQREATAAELAAPVATAAATTTTTTAAPVNATTTDAETYHQQSAASQAAEAGRGDTFVISVFLDETLFGNAADVLTVIKAAPVGLSVGASATTTVVGGAPIDPDMLLPDSLEYIYYSGYEPKPPCTDPVDYALVLRLGTISTQQLHAVRSLLFGHAAAATDAAFAEYGLARRNSAFVKAVNPVFGRGTVESTLVIPARVTGSAAGIEYPAEAEPIFLETKLALAAVCLSGAALVLAALALGFSICRTRQVFNDLK